MKSKTKILQVVIKNTSTLDFSLPLLCFLKNRLSGADISILYCVANKNEILLDSNYYTNELIKHNINQFDLLDFLPIFLRKFEFIIRKCFNPYNNETYLNIKLSSDPFLLKVPKYLVYIIKKIMKSVKEKILKILLNNSDIIGTINPDIVLLDNRSDISFPGDKEIFDCLFKTKKIKIVLLPHAPHYISSCFSHVDPNPFDRFYSECDIWMPFLPATPWINRPDLKKYFFYSGYPGFDSECIKYFKASAKEKKDKIYILYIGRKFLDKNVERPKKYNFVTMDYDEVLHQINCINKSLKDLNIEFNLIYKAHPSSNNLLVEKMLDESDVISYECSFDAIYSFVSKVDLVISPYSTALFLFAISGIPTVLFKSKMMDEAISSWEVLSNLYENMSYYCNQEDMKEVLNRIFSDNGNDAMKDVMHIRGYFPDNSLENCYNRILDLKKNGNIYD
mgnify:CR=1 FL=1